jgi:hypothetical protein
VAECRAAERQAVVAADRAVVEPAGCREGAAPAGKAVRRDPVELEPAEAPIKAGRVAARVAPGPAAGLVDQPVGKGLPVR